MRAENECGTIRQFRRQEVPGGGLGPDLLGAVLDSAVPVTEKMPASPYHASGITSAQKQDPLDQSGRPDIKAGELAAARFSNSSSSTRVQLGDFNERCGLAQIHSNICCGEV